MTTAAPSEFSTAEEDLLQRVANELKWKVSGEVRFDTVSRALYATDASPYEIKPYGVVLPKTTNDIRQVLEVANRYGLPILPRGGGTSLAGQTVGAAIVLDFSKYLNGVLEFNEAERWVRTQPGMVRDNLNLYLAPHKLQFTPDVATSSRANIGGMVGNNSSGTRSIKYGKTVDQVLAATVMLSDGSVTELRELTGEELARKFKLTGLEGDIYRTVHRIVTEHAGEIEANFPKVMRRVGGYNLDEFTGGKPFNLAKLVCGSEGTLAVILEVTLRLEPVPRQQLLAMLHFTSLEDALTAVQYVNRRHPSAVEILDKTLLTLSRDIPSLDPSAWLSGDPVAVLMVEFDGEREEEMLANLESMQADPEIAELSYACHVARGESEQRRLWAFRQGGLGIFNTIKGDAKPQPFIEDCAIPVEKLPRYIPEVLEVCANYGVKAVMYAHASVGVIHVRPILNLKDAADVEKFGKISADVFQLVKKYGGSWSGEHGDGLIRSYQNKNLFGEVLFEDFRTIKRTFDPKNLLNPGKIVGAPAMTENLRYGADYHVSPINTYFDFSHDGGFAGAVEMCSGVGHCRKTTTGTMCPSYMVTRDEDHSTRGRANALREAMSGRMPGGLTSKQVYDVLDLCLECKACKAECPSQVDMAKIKYEFLAQYHDAHGTPLSARAMGNVAKVAPLGRLAAPLVNRLLPLKPVRLLIEKTVGVDKRRVLPLYADSSFAHWQREHAKGRGTDAERPAVALFADTWTMYHNPEIGVAATRVLEALGYRVEAVPYRCCGRPQISKGLLKSAQRLARGNVKRLHAYAKRGVPVVGLEPSCVTAFCDDYRDLVPGEATEEVAKNVKMIDQFLAKEWAKGSFDPKGVFQQNGTPLLFHGHCQQKAIIGSAPSKAVLGWVSEHVEETDSGCCGMAGSFGYNHYDLSMQLGERRLFPAAREHEGEIVACGFSCRHQLHDGTGKRAKHIAEVMADALEPH